MKRTTIYLSEDLKAALERAAGEDRRTESDLIREGLERLLSMRAVGPRLPLFESRLPGDAAEHIDEYLEGFGED